MNAFGLHFHHLGLAVRRPADAVRFVSGLGYAVADPVHDPAQQVDLRMCTHPGGMPDVEIISPPAQAARSPIDAFLRIRPDGLVYHVGYRTADLAACLAAMEQSGLRPICVSPPTPAILFGDRRVSFYNVVGIGLCEIIED